MFAFSNRLKGIFNPFFIILTIVIILLGSAFIINTWNKTIIEYEKNGVNPLYIHLFRDGRDVALSFKKAIVGEKHMYHIAKQWKEEQEASLRLAEKVGANLVLKVRYEDLLHSPENELQKICCFMGADYNPVAMDYYHSEESHKTAHSGVMWENVEKPVIADNFNKFKKELSPDDIQIFKQVAVDTLEKLGFYKILQNSFISRI